MTEANGKNWLKKVILTNLITIVVGAAIFYGITITTNANQDRRLENLEEGKASKELVEHQYNEIIRELQELKDAIKE